MWFLFRRKPNSGNEIKKHIEDFINSKEDLGRMPKSLKEIHISQIYELIKYNELKGIPHQVIMKKYFEVRPGKIDFFRDVFFLAHCREVRETLQKEYNIEYTDVMP